MIETIGHVLGTSYTSGMKLYATVASLGLLHRLEYVQLPESLQVMANPIVLTVAIVLYVIEFIVDKFDFFDAAWDLIHAFIRLPAAAIISYSAIGPVGEPWKIGAALVGAGVAGTSLLAKQAYRRPLNLTGEPVSTAAVSLGEDVFVVFLVWLTVAHPILTGAIVVILLIASIYIIHKMFSLAKRGIQKGLEKVRNLFRKQSTGGA